MTSNKLWMQFLCRCDLEVASQVADTGFDPQAGQIS